MCNSTNHMLRAAIIAREMQRAGQAILMLDELKDTIVETTGMSEFGAGLAIGIMYAEDGFPGLDQEQLTEVIALVSAQNELNKLTGKEEKCD